MIARIWHGVVAAEHADLYAGLVRSVIIPDYRGVPGNRGAWCLRREEDGLVHFELLSFWDDVEAIRLFAGDDYDRARYYDFDDEYLTEKEPHVRHYDVCAQAK